MSAVPQSADASRTPVTYDRHPETYVHWQLKCDGNVATLAMNVNEEKGLKPGYELKLNSYDLGVDIELYDALNRIRFEHPEVKVVVVTSARERMFCSGANIYMLGLSTHGWKVNFCKFTNETRNGIEDSSRDGLKFLAAVNGTVAGGGYELALACDEILMIDDRSSSGQPARGAAARRAARHRRPHPRHRQAQGAARPGRRLLHHQRRRARRPRQAVEAGRPHRQAAGLRAGRQGAHRSADGAERAPRQPARASRSRRSSAPSTMPATTTSTSMSTIDRKARTATITVSRAEGRAADRRRRASSPPARLVAARDGARARRRDPDAAHQRTRGRHLAAEDPRRHRRGARGRRDPARHRDDWFVRETLGLLRRTLARLDVTSRTLFAIVDQGSCFAGTLAGARARRRPQLHAAAARRARPARRASCCRS